MTLDDFLKTVPESKKDEVERTRDRYNIKVREILRRETGLRFSRSEGEDATQVRISIEAGLPASIVEKKLPTGSEVAALLAPWSSIIKDLYNSSESTLKVVIPHLLTNQEVPKLVDELKTELEPANEIVKRLLEETQKIDLVKWLLNYNEDVLGVYRFCSVNKPQRGRGGDGSSIELYWGVIGLVSMMIGCSVEAITLVVLAHELAHAYTHLGFDIDGERWSNENFAKAETELVEGLAQYYTSRVCTALLGIDPSFNRAYKTLLVKQPAPYRTHVPWLENYKPEEIRLSMIEGRRQSIGELEDFNRLLLQSKNRLRPSTAGSS